MEKIQHRTVKVNGINMHVAEVAAASEGRAPVLFLHGFPELWYSWRHQMVAVAAAGYRAIAPDLRGYGDSDAPPSPSSYTAFHIVGDLVALLDHLGLHKPVFIAGHDWGAIIAYYFALFRHDRVKAIVNLSVPFMPRYPQIKPLDGFKFAFGDDFYICRFQDPNFEEEFANVDIVKWLKQLMGSRSTSPAVIPKEKLRALSDAPVECPPWLSEEDVNYFAEKIKQRGITGGLNYYRALNTNWELMAAWTGAQIKVPVKFIAGELDMTLNFPGMKEYVSKGGGFKRDVPLLDEIVIVQGAAHFVQQEKPEEINTHIIDYLNLF